MCTITVLINKIVCDHVTYSTSIGNSFQPCAHMYTITCGQPESFCLSEKYLQSLEAPLVHNSTWRNASLYLSSLLQVRAAHHLCIYLKRFVKHPCRLDYHRTIMLNNVIKIALMTKYSMGAAIFPFSIPGTIRH